MTANGYGFSFGGEKKGSKFYYDVQLVVQLNKNNKIMYFDLGDSNFEIQSTVSIECILLSHHHKVKTSLSCTIISQESSAC